MKNNIVVMLSCSVMSSSLPPPWTVAHEVPLSKEFSRQGYERGLSFPPPEDLPDQESNLSPATPELAGRFFTTEPPGLQWNKIENLEINLCICVQWFSARVAKTFKQERISCSSNGAMTALYSQRSEYLCIVCKKCTPYIVYKNQIKVHQKDLK